jgi:hypothetical protein
MDPRGRGRKRRKGVRGAVALTRHVEQRS